MTDLLSKEAYEAIAANINFATEAFIDGRCQKPKLSGSTLAKITSSTILASAPAIGNN